MQSTLMTVYGISPPFVCYFHCTDVSTLTTSSAISFLCYFLCLQRCWFESCGKATVSNVNEFLSAVLPTFSSRLLCSLSLYESSPVCCICRGEFLPLASLYPSASVQFKAKTKEERKHPVIASTTLRSCSVSWNPNGKEQTSKQAKL